MTFPKDLVRQNDMVYAKIQLLLSLLRSINLTFSKINGTAFSVKKNGEVKIFGKRLQDSQSTRNSQSLHFSTEAFQFFE